MLDPVALIVVPTQAINGCTSHSLDGHWQQTPSGWVRTAAALTTPASDEAGCASDRADRAAPPSPPQPYQRRDWAGSDEAYPVPPPLALRAHSCKQVPRSFHATFACNWRSYMYLFPLCERDLRAMSDSAFDPLAALGQHQTVFKKAAGAAAASATPTTTACEGAGAAASAAPSNQGGAGASNTASTEPGAAPASPTVRDAAAAASSLAVGEAADTADAATAATAAADGCADRRQDASSTRADTTGAAPRTPPGSDDVTAPGVPAPEAAADSGAEARSTPGGTLTASQRLSAAAALGDAVDTLLQGLGGQDVDYFVYGRSTPRGKGTVCQLLRTSAHVVWVPGGSAAGSLPPRPQAEEGQAAVFPEVCSCLCVRRSKLPLEKKNKQQLQQPVWLDALCRALSAACVDCEDGQTMEADTQHASTSYGCRSISGVVAGPLTGLTAPVPNRRLCTRLCCRVPGL